MTTLRDHARQLAMKTWLRQDQTAMTERCEHADEYISRCGECEWNEYAAAMEQLARDFAAEALRSVYEVDDNDKWSSDGERARGSFRVKHEYCGNPNVERRHYRKEFEAMIAAAIAAAAARAEAFDRCADMLDERADEWRRTAAELAAKGAPPELRNRAHDMKDEAARWAKRIRAAKGGANG